MSKARVFVLFFCGRSKGKEIVATKGAWVLGGFVETVLSAAPLRAVADLFSALPALKVALLPPVDVDTVARAIASAPRASI